MDTLKSAIDRGYAFNEEQQRLLDEKQITETEWFENNRKHYTSHYLACSDPRGQSGHSGDEARYRYTQSMVLDAIDRTGSFIDIGCANGYLMEKLAEWTKEAGRDVELYGLDISPELVALAKQRLPMWPGRFFIGNALYWIPPRDFDMVCVKELGYVPQGKRRALFENLYDNVVKPGGRLILGPITEPKEARSVRDEIAEWGYPCASCTEKPHQDHEELIRRVFWFDRTE
jgi:SAM-dependent methyltransferase